MSKGSRLQRAVDYFREAPLDEARVAHQLVREVMDERFKAVPKPAMIRKHRKPRAANIVTGQKADLIDQETGVVASA